MFKSKIFSCSQLKTLLTLCIGTMMTIVLLTQNAVARPPSPYLHARSEWVSVGSRQSVTLTWSCPTNRYTVGGGFETEGISGNPFGGFKVVNSYPSDYRTWQLRLLNTDDVARNVKIYNVCALP